MATFLDISLLGGAKVLFTFLLVYVIVWGLLVWIKPFGKSVSAGPYTIIALVAAFFSAVSGTVRYLIEFVTPWFLFLILFLFFVLFIIRMFNVSEGDLRAIIGNSTVHILILALIGIIMLFGLGNAFGQQSLEATQGRVQPPYSQTYPSQAAPSGVLHPATGELQPGNDIQDATSRPPQPGEPGATATGSFSLNVINTLLHPKVMAVIALLLISVIIVWLIGRPEFV